MLQILRIYFYTVTIDGSLIYKAPVFLCASVYGKITSHNFMFFFLFSCLRSQGHVIQIKHGTSIIESCWAVLYLVREGMWGEEEGLAYSLCYKGVF